ncbi:MAG: hypothetical protein F4233_09915 [Rhodospirillaceae bacterium]|nr:hypothetical protein [Rhodospirillaceae bacterium]
MTAAVLDIIGGPAAVRTALPDKGERGKDRCRCPACDGPATVRSADRQRYPGRTLLTCWGGCERAAIVAAARDRLPVAESETRRHGPEKGQRAPRPDSACLGAQAPRSERPAPGIGGQNGDSRGPGGQRAGQPTAKTTPEPPAPGVVAMWRAATADPAACRPILANLDGRRAWLPDRPLPRSVRWLEAAYLVPVYRGRDCPFPDGAAGAAIYAFADPATHRHLCGLQIEPLARNGNRVRWPNGKSRMTAAGSRMQGSVFTAGAGAATGPDDPLHVAEGVTDALAIRTWRGIEAWAEGGTNYLALAPALAATGRPVVIEADSGKPDDPKAAGPRQAARLCATLQAHGARCRIEWADDDPAADLAALADGADDWIDACARFQERAAVLQFDCGLDRAAAERQAINELRPAGSEAEPGAIAEPTTQTVAGNGR